MHGVSSPVVVIVLACAGLCQVGISTFTRLLHRLELENRSYDASIAPTDQVMKLASGSSLPPPSARSDSAST